MGTKWIFIGLALAGSVFGQGLAFDIDTANTQVEYTLGDVLHTVHGTFRPKTGHIHVDPATGAAGGLLVVDATSGASGSDGRDSRMHKNILESDKFPEITFAPDRVIGKLNPTGTSDVHLHGMFTIHGAAHEITVPAHVQIGGDHLTATAQFPVPYVKWGMKNPSTFILRVKDTVQIDLKVSGKIQPTN